MLFSSNYSLNNFSCFLFSHRETDGRTDTQVDRDSIHILREEAISFHGQRTPGTLSLFFLGPNSFEANEASVSDRLRAAVDNAISGHSVIPLTALTFPSGYSLLIMQTDTDLLGH